MEEEPKEGAPAWMVSFGDMMTLILTFFILLVSMSTEQQQGLVAQGIGSFIITLRSFGLPGLLSEEEKASVFDNVRMRFNLPPEEDSERREKHEFATSMEVLKAKGLESLQAHDELNQPLLAAFPEGSDQLTADAQNYIDLLAPTLRPVRGQMLQLEGHAYDAGPEHGNDNHWLALSRSLSVRSYLIEEHDFKESRVEARAWVAEIDPPSPATRGVDARLILPASESTSR
ncbi:MAG: flagellar motor protein MotB [Planctomycetota bacterium]